MNNTSGFRNIEFTEVKCNFSRVEIFKTTRCISGMIYIQEVPTNFPCKECNGTGIADKVESKIE